MPVEHALLQNKFCRLQCIQAGYCFSPVSKAENAYLPGCCKKLEQRILSRKVRSVNSFSPMLLAMGYRRPMKSKKKRTVNGTLRNSVYGRLV